jgi:colanic acid/amylovoran biosynthesis protein
MDLNKVMKILVTGQCTLHWGRMEFGNIGNYYIIEPFFRELYQVFPDSEIVTTFQLTDEFCKYENIKTLPMFLYYGWNDDDLLNAYKEFAISTIFKKTGKIIDSTPYIEEVLSSDLVIDFSGDMWGDNADLVGKNRFLVGLLKDRTVQLLERPIAMLAGSPGPFTNYNLLPFAQEVFTNFNLVTNREKISSKKLLEYGFELNNVINLACPSFLFEASSEKEVEPLIKNTPLINKTKPIVGFILCGWNFLEAPFSKFPREEYEYTEFIKVVEYIAKVLDIRVCLMSHSNGFERLPYFKLIHGRDYPIAKQIYSSISNDYKDNVFLLDGIYSPSETKGIICYFDMLVSGRVHGAIAGLSQSIPTVIIDYGHEPKAHKLYGFAQMLGMEEFVANPASSEDMIKKINRCWTNKDEIKSELNEKNQETQVLAKKNFELLKELINK